ncbi:MAG TPA: VOC family protein [Magnetospirillaceae bacterium]|nr:VOC family protein [Magnetospirillaceae bacterium]
MSSALNGKFVWYELHTSDLDGAETFYGKVLGWTPRDAGVPDFRYTLNSAGDRDVTGMMTPMTPDSPRAWYGYIAVDDIDTAAAGVEKAGATCLIPIHPIPGIGRFTMVSDPQGAVFALIQYEAPEFPRPTVPTHGIHGHGWWRELHTSDQNAAYDFYSGQFGWGKGYAMDMEPIGVYQLLTPAEGGEGNGAMFNDRHRPPFWLFYFWVDDIDAAHEAVLAGGGKVVNGPMEVPSNAWVLEGRDPQGVTFALVGYRKKK